MSAPVPAVPLGIPVGGPVGGGVAVGRGRGRSRVGRLVFAVFVLGVLALLAWGILGRRADLDTLATVSAEEAVPPVQVISPAAGPQRRTLDLPGNISAWYSAPIFAQVSGYVGHWNTDIGAHVRRGDVLATIDAPTLDAQYQSARADLDVAQARQTLAVATARRWRALAGTRSVSQQSIDEQVTAASAAEETVLAARHEVARYQAMEAFKTIVAPFDGVVTARNTDIGDYVNASGGDATGRPTASSLFQVADIHRMRVFVAVPQDYAGMLKPGLTASLALPQYPGRVFAATFQTTAQAFNPQSRTAVTELLVDNPDGALWPGTFAQVHFSIPSDPRTLILPEQALLFRPQGVQVLRLDGSDVVHLQGVTLGLNFGRTVQVLEGVSAGDRLVNNPNAGLLEGERVSIVPGAAGMAPAPEFRVGASPAPPPRPGPIGGRVAAASLVTLEPQ